MKPVANKLIFVMCQRVEVLRILGLMCASGFQFLYHDCCLSDALNLFNQFKFLFPFLIEFKKCEAHAAQPQALRGCDFLLISFILYWNLNFHSAFYVAFSCFWCVACKKSQALSIVKTFVMQNWSKINTWNCTTYI